MKYATRHGLAGHLGRHTVQERKAKALTSVKTVVKVVDGVDINNKSVKVVDESQRLLKVPPPPQGFIAPSPPSTTSSGTGGTGDYKVVSMVTEVPEEMNEMNEKEHQEGDENNNEHRSNNESTDERTTNEKSTKELTKERRIPLDDRISKLVFDPEAMMQSITTMVNKSVKDALKAKGLARAGKMAPGKGFEPLRPRRATGSLAYDRLKAGAFGPRIVWAC